MTPVRPFWQVRSHALIARYIIFPRAQILTTLLLPRGAFMIALEVPIRLQRPFLPTLAR
jgi:hypothetical protein